MNIPMSWLKDYINIDCSIKEFEDRLTMSGSKVEKTEEVAKDIKGVVVGKILKIEQHEDAERLVVCQVDVGTEKLQIVTAAKNVFEGAVVIVSLVGAVLANNFKIKKGKLRGVASEGMFCSVEELGFKISDFPESDPEGIYIFKDEVEVGICAKEALMLEETIVEFEITSNRADCLSVLGIARETSATFNIPFKKKEIVVKEELKEKIEDIIKVTVESEYCNRYTARVIKNVEVKESPLWMRRRLVSAGIRPINNIVDITNYVLVEYGQPLHAFDLCKVDGREIIVKDSEKKEKVICLDGIEREIPEKTIVIRDVNKTLAVGGIIGLENSKVENNTVDILLECASFDGTNVRLSSKALVLRTDSSGKFEKGLDREQNIEVINRATALIEELGKGKTAKGIVDVYKNKQEVSKVKFEYEKINKLLGTDIEESDMIAILKRLELEVVDGYVVMPSFRENLKIMEDIAEEVGRIYGYDNIPTVLLSSGSTMGIISKEAKVHKIIKNIMTSLGSYECKNYSFEGEGVFDKLNIIEDSSLRNAIKILNPLGKEFSIMRTTTLNGMLTSLSANYNKQVEKCNLFEVGKIYLPKQLPIEELPVERNILTIGMYGNGDFYAIKGMIESVLEKLNIEDVKFVADKNITYLHLGRSAVCHINGERLCEIGEVHPRVLENYGIKSRAYVAEINVDLLVKYANLENKYKELPKYQNSTRDISITLKENIEVAEIENVIFEKGGKNLENIELFDVYQGEQVEKGYKSVAYKLSFRAKDRTLTEEEINSPMKKIIKNLEDKLEGTLRS